MSETIKVAVKLEDGVSGPAKTASQALADLRQGLDRSSAELGQMKKAMREMKAAGDTSSASFKTLEEQIKTKTGAIGSMRAKYIELGGDFRKVKPPVKELRATAQAAQDAVAPTSALGGMMAKLGGTLAAGAAAAVAAVGAALVALAAATVAAGAALLSYGISQADARRSEGLRLEGLTRLRRGYQAAGGSASEMQASIDRVSDSSSASRSTLEGYAERLHRLGLRGDNFTAALEGMATRGEVLGDRYAQSFAGMAAATARAGGSVRALANDVQARLGDLAGKKLIALDVTTRKLRENFESLFRGVKIEGFLRLFREVASTFSQARVTGRALAGIMERMFAPLDAAAENSVGTVREFFARVVLGALRVEGAILGLRRMWLESWVAMNSIGITMDGTMNAIRIVLGTIGAVIYGALVQPFVDVAKVLWAVGHGFGTLVVSGQKMVSRFRAIWDGLDMRAIARQMITGLATGIISGTVQVVQAVVTMASATTSALREALEIKSPSRVFAGLGREIPRGLAVGIDAGSGAADAAIANMIDVTGGDVVAPSAGGAQGAARGSTSISIGDIIISSTATDAPGMAQDIRRAIAEALEGLVIMAGEPAA